MLLVAGAFIAAYVKIAVVTQQLTDIPMNWAFLLSGILGLGILDKYVTMRGKDGGSGKAV